jgi:hypothetical protein
MLQGNIGFKIIFLKRIVVKAYWLLPCQNYYYQAYIYVKRHFVNGTIDLKFITDE